MEAFKGNGVPVRRAAHLFSGGVAYAIVLLAIAVIYSIMSYLTPPQFDDLAFMSLYREWNNGSSEISLSAIFRFCQELRQEDNSRLANMLSPFSTIIAPWRDLFPYVTGVMVSAIVFLGVGMCRRAVGNRFYCSILLWAMMILFLPWRNNLFVADYSLNYIYAAAVTLLFIHVMTCGMELLRNKVVFFPVALLAVIAGMWHEGFSVPTLAGLGIWFMKRFIKSRRLGRDEVRWLVVYAVSLAATCYIVFCPGVMTRSGREIGAHFNNIGLKTVVDLAPSIILVLSVGVMSCFRSKRHSVAEAFRSDDFFVLFFVSVAAASLSLVVRHTPRTSFFPSLCSIISLLILYRRPLNAMMRAKYAPAVSCGLLALCVAQSVYAVFVQKKFYDEYKEILALVAASDSSTIYYDCLSPDDVSVATLYMPARTAWVTGYHYFWLGKAMGRGDEISVVPTSLRHTPQSTEIISAINSKHVIRRSENALFTDHIPDLNTADQALLRLRRKGAPADEVVGALVLNFVNEDGDSLAYIRPYRIALQDIDLIEEIL